MAKTTTEKGAVLEAKTTAEQLKRKQQILAQSIVEEDDYALEAADCGTQALSCLKELKLKLSNQQSLLLTLPPLEFRCPLSGQLMIDPVVIASGQVHATCDQQRKREG